MVLPLSPFSEFRPVLGPRKPWVKSLISKFFLVQIRLFLIWGIPEFGQILRQLYRRPVRCCRPIEPLLRTLFVEVVVRPK